MPQHNEMNSRDHHCVTYAVSCILATPFLALQPLFRDYGGHLRFRGRAATVKCFEVGAQGQGGWVGLGMYMPGKIRSVLSLVVCGRWLPTFRQC